MYLYVLPEDFWLDLNTTTVIYYLGYAWIREVMQTGEVNQS